MRVPGILENHAGGGEREGGEEQRGDAITSDVDAETSVFRSKTRPISWPGGL